MTWIWIVASFCVGMSVGVVLSARLAVAAAKQQYDPKSTAAYKASVDCLATMMKADARHKVTGMRRGM